VALDRWDGDHREELAQLPGVSTATSAGDKMRLYTDDPPAVLEEVMRFAQGRGRRVITLNTLGPSLEDVFLRITGQEVGTVHHGPGAGERGPGRKGKGR